MTDTLSPPFVNDVEAWVDPSGRQLSDRIWSNRQRTRETINRILDDAIRDGTPLDDVARELSAWVRPGISGGKAHYHATRLAQNEMRRGHSLATRGVAMTDPASGFLKFNLNPNHIEIDVCDSYANHDEGLGQGVYPAWDCPLPPVHIGDRCDVEAWPWEKTGSSAAKGMSDFVEGLRVEYELEDPPDLTPEDLAIFRRETAGVRQAVQVMVRAWFEQTGLVTPQQLEEASPSVGAWVERVKREKRLRRLGDV